MGYLTSIKSWIKSYLINLITFVIGVGTSWVLTSNSPYKLVGIFYFASNVLIGAIVWKYTNTQSLKKSLITTFIFYACVGTCGILAILIADTLLDELRKTAITISDLSEKAFYCLVIGLIPAIILNSWLYVVIKENIPEMCDQIYTKYFSKPRFQGITNKKRPKVKAKNEK